MSFHTNAWHKSNVGVWKLLTRTCAFPPILASELLWEVNIVLLHPSMQWKAPCLCRKLQLKVGVWKKKKSNHGHTHDDPVCKPNRKEEIQTFNPILLRTLSISTSRCIGRFKFSPRSLVDASTAGSKTSTALPASSVAIEVNHIRCWASLLFDHCLLRLLLLLSCFCRTSIWRTFFFHLVIIDGEPSVTSCHLEQRRHSRGRLWGGMRHNISLGRIYTHYRFEKQRFQRKSQSSFSR